MRWEKRLLKRARTIAWAHLGGPGIDHLPDADRVQVLEDRKAALMLEILQVMLEVANLPITKRTRLREAIAAEIMPQ